MRTAIFCIVFFLSTSVFAASNSTNDKTVDNIVSEVRYILNATVLSGTTDKMFPDSYLETWINNGIRSIAAWTHCIEASEKFTLSSGTSEYALTSGYIGIKGVKYQSGATEYKSLNHGSPGGVGRIEGNFDHPEFWYEGIGTVGVYPLKDSDDVTVTGNTLYVTFVPTHTTLSGSSTVTTPQQYNDLITFYAAMMSCLRDKNFNMYNTIKELYFLELSRFREDFIYKPKESLLETVKQ